ncbi:MAG: NACHT domain-containing protein [Acidobacteria bacterium]|nr:NACHT domain-containing protein [Acidobacteriota bacterium]
MLTRDAALRAVPPFLDRLGSEYRRGVQSILGLLKEDGRANLGEVLRLLYPGSNDQQGQAKLQQLSLAIKNAARKGPPIELWLKGDGKTRSLPDDRWIWFEGKDPLLDYLAASVGERVAGWIDIDAAGLGPLHCHVLYAEQDKAAADQFVELLRPHLKGIEVDIWTPDAILPGEDVEEERHRSEERCLWAVALLSPEFFADAKLQAAWERLGRRVIPVSLYETGRDEEVKVFRDSGKSFGTVRDKRAWVLRFFERLRLIRGYVRVLLPEPEGKFVDPLATGLSFERGVELTNERLREVSGRSAIDQLVEWAADPKGTPYCALLGELGMGKTTTAKELVRRIEGRVPLYFDLRNVREMAKHGDDCPGLKAILKSLVEKQTWEGGPGIRALTVEDVIRMAALGALVIFDGLDEVLVGLTPARQQLFTRQLFSLVPARKDTKGRILITCRSHFFRTIAEQSAHFTTEDRDAVTAQSYTALVLLPFREQQIREYLRLTLGEDEGTKAYDVISSVHNLPELAERPYTLTLIRRQFHRLELEKVAGRRITGLTLYRFFVEEWLLRDQGKHVIRPDDKRLLMEELAAELARRGQRSWTARELEVWMAGQGRHTADLLAEQDVRNATFLVREGDGFRFAHSSLQEYFLAGYLRRALEEGRPEDWAFAQGVSRETLDFLGQSLQESPGEGAQAGLKRLRDGYRKHASELALRFFALAFAKGYPCPAAVRFQLAGANLREFQADFGEEGERFDLSGACFDGARLANSYWRGCRLTGASFAVADAARSEWHRCDLRESKWGGAEMTALLGRWCDVRGAAFAGATQRSTRWVLCEGAVQAVVPGSKELALQHGHSNWVRSVAWSADGRRLASGSSDNTVRIWDGETGECERTLAGHSNGVWSVAWSADGRRLASGSVDNTVRIWDGETGECERTLAGHSNGVWSVAWSADGRRLASGSEDKTVRIWDGETGECERTLAGHSNGVWSVTWSADGRRLASGSVDNTVRTWDAETFAEIQPRRYVLPDPHGSPTWAAVDVAAHRIVACGPGAWRFFRWRVPGSETLLPAEAFGELGERGLR